MSRIHLFSLSNRDALAIPDRCVFLPTHLIDVPSYSQRGVSRRKGCIRAAAKKKPGAKITGSF